MIGFGAGDIFLVASGSAYKCGDCQEINLDISEEEKLLYGAKKHPIMVAHGKAKIGLKLTFARLQGGVIAAVLGAAYSVGRRIGVIDEPSGVIAAGTFAVANPTGFLNQALRDENGYPLSPVVGAPQAGQYQVSAAGAYTVHASANGKVYKASYSYADAVNGRTVALVNGLMGLAPQFAIGGYNTEPDGSKAGLYLYAVSLNKLGLAFKNEEFTMPSLDGTAYADAQDRVLDLYLPNAE
jgi:hypothetical protein